MFEANQLIKKEFGLDIYEELINNIDPSDKEWQKNFKKYYGVMKRDEKWQEAFFDVFKEFSERKNVNAKRKQSDLFCEVLTRVKDKLNKSGTRNTSRVEELADEIDALREEKQDLLVEDANRAAMKQRLDELEEFLDEHQEPVTDYDEGMVRRLIERITVYEDHLDFEFKSGLETEVQM